MGYLALLFCPDEKTARTVTQVLGELEFNVESCTEPFAAVKKLMGQHFDAVVVDCDNEQNATLLFKSARNSTSNQASLAVAVVEGQAGVAKAFRIGANLVLTKPINIEQAKGTLRVARGLLRKSEPAKPAVSTTASPLMPSPTKSVTNQKPAPPAISATSTRTRVDASSWPAAATANLSAAAQDQDEDLLGIGGKDSVVAPFNQVTTSAPPIKSLPTPVASAEPEARIALQAGLSSTSSSGAASAPAPARESQSARIVEAPPARAAEADAGLKKAEIVQTESSPIVGSAPSFTFGGVNTPAESGGKKKIFLGLAAAVIIAGGGYAGWTHFQDRPSEPQGAPIAPISAPVATTNTANPSSAQPAPTSAAPKTSISSPTSSSSSPLGTLPAKTHVSDDTGSAESVDLSPAPTSTKPSSKTSAAGNTPVDETKPSEAPLVVKGGQSPTTHAKPAAADTPAPSMIGIATAGASAPPPDLGSSAEVAPRPLLQTLNISQGVSRGLLFKKVQPVYPRNALSMHLEGTVELMATISKTGDITHVKVLSGDSQLAKAATDAVRQWKYKSYLLNGEPVEIQTQVTIKFNLPK